MSGGGELFRKQRRLPAHGKTLPSRASTSAHSRRTTRARKDGRANGGAFSLRAQQRPRRRQLNSELFDDSRLEPKHKCMQISRTAIKAPARRQFSLRLIRELEDKSVSETLSLARARARAPFRRRDTCKHTRRRARSPTSRSPQPPVCR